MAQDATFLEINHFLSKMNYLHTSSASADHWGLEQEGCQKCSGGNPSAAAGCCWMPPRWPASLVLLASLMRLVAAAVPALMLDSAMSAAMTGMRGLLIGQNTHEKCAEGFRSSVLQQSNQTIRLRFMGWTTGCCVCAGALIAMARTECNSTGVAQEVNTESMLLPSWMVRAAFNARFSLCIARGAESLACAACNLPAANA